MATKARPNLLFITLDQWRGDGLQHLGHPFLRTPVLSALAARGVTFAAHFGQSTPCAPSRASMFTSRYLHGHRVYTNQTPLDAHLRTMPFHLRALGYEPFLAGYTSTMWPREGASPADPQVNGPKVGPGWSVLREMDAGKRHYLAYLNRLGYGRVDSFARIFDRVQRRDGIVPSSPIDEAHSETAWIVDAAAEFIAYGRDEPWALHVSIFKPHPPCYPSTRWAEAVRDRAGVPPTRTLADGEAIADHPFMRYAARRIRGDYLWNDLTGLASDLPAATVETIRRAYWAVCEEVDAQVGRLLAALDASGQRDDTLIVLTSDHAEMLGDHRSFGKYTIFPESFHIPLIVVDPAPDCDATRGRVVRDVSEGVDILPTIMACVGGAEDPLWEGRSLRPYLLGDAVPGPKTTAFYDYDFRFDPDPTLGDLARLPADARSVSVALGERYLVACFPMLEPIVFERHGAGFDFAVARGASRDEGLAHGTQALLRNRLRLVGEPLRVPLSGSMAPR
jgi:arylsulfatase A-like enzyme